MAKNPWACAILILNFISVRANIHIFYYSRTGNTRMTCEALQKELNAQLVEIKDLTDRSGSWGGFTGMLNTLFNMVTGVEPEHPDGKPEPVSPGSASNTTMPKSPEPPVCFT